MTRDGSVAFEKARRAVAEEAQLASPSDADVIEYLARQWVERKGGGHDEEGQA